MHDQPEPGVAHELEPGVRRVLAPNPSPMTHWGTNTYLVGTDELAVIDPGPADAGHLAALRTAIGAARVSHILITHAHRDHSPLAAELQAATGAPVLAFGRAEAGRSPVMARLAAEGLVGGGEGVDAGFQPDETLADGDRITGPDWALQAIHTPGHFAGHLSFALNDAVFTGDHVMGWASTLISPPDGDLTAFMASCDRLLARSDRVYYPGHGAPIPDARARTEWLVAHRKGREAQILEALTNGPAGATTLATAIYTDTPPALLPAAVRNVLAHLIDLENRGRVYATPSLSADAEFSAV
ncbi:MAG: MBL fold metallo-hydrolase [Pseudomonadota bacterium]